MIYKYKIRLFRREYSKYNYQILISVIVLLLAVVSCRKEDSNNGPPVDDGIDTITIFSINDPHAQINNFSKIKYIVDKAESQGNVIVVSAGDIFSGNPVVDFTTDKGYPMIDLMNKSGFDVAVLGNHEFDYGQEILADRMEQAEFDFICANADMSGTIVPQPEPYVTISSGDLDITFLGMVQTSYTSGVYIPATHPLRVEGITFQPASDIMNDYANLKEDTESDLLILLSHLGTGSDYYMAENYPFLDVVIGGHSHAVIDDVFNDIPIYQCGSYLNYLGKIMLVIKDREIISEDFELINLWNYPDYDSEMALLIEDYNHVPELEEVIGYNQRFISKNTGLGCFYTDALRISLGTDISFQNGGGIRNSLDEGDITVREIYEIDPFNNGAHTYSMKAETIKRFFEETGAGLHYSGVIFESNNGHISIKRPDGTEISNETVLTVGVNDYIPAIYAGSFPDNPTINDKTTAELIIEYIRSNGTVDYDGCNRYFSASK